MWWINLLTLTLFYIAVTKVYMIMIYFFGSTDGAKRVIKNLLPLKIREFFIALFVSLINIIIFAHTNEGIIISISFAAIHSITILLLNKATENG